MSKCRNCGKPMTGDCGWWKHSDSGYFHCIPGRPECAEVIDDDTRQWKTGFSNITPLYFYDPRFGWSEEHRNKYQPTEEILKLLELKEG